jgi:translation elongation factor EF-G
MTSVAIEAPVRTAGAVVASVAQVGGEVEAPAVRGEVATVTALLPAIGVHELRRRLANVTRGEASLEAAFGGYSPVAGEPPRRS